MRRIREKDKEWLLANYYNMSQEECAKELDVSVRTVARWAGLLDLKKTKGRRTSSEVLQSQRAATLYRKDCIVCKCCYLCAEFPLCTNQRGENPFKMVCWDFKLKEELK